MHILLFILVFFIAILVFGLSIIGFILRAIFGIGRRSSSPRPGQANSRTQHQSTKTYSTNDNDEEENVYSENVSEKKHKKIFTKEDGEYVDFEEIK